VSVVIGLAFQALAIHSIDRIIKSTFWVVLQKLIEDKQSSLITAHYAATQKI